MRDAPTTARRSLLGALRTLQVIVFVLVQPVMFVLLLSYAFTWFYVVVALAVKNPEAAQSAGFVLTFPLTFAGSAFVTTATMPGWLRSFAGHQPVTLAADAARSLTGVGDASARPVLAWAAALLLTLVPLSVALFRRAA